ncbi:MAG: hypothetical protein ACTHMM_21330 [Agriterribacter sp.]
MSERKVLLRQFKEQKSLISKARKLFIDNKLKFDDFKELKREYQEASGVLQKEFESVTNKIKSLNRQIAHAKNDCENIFYVYEHMDIADKSKL